jgi:hypothetical protein
MPIIQDDQSTAAPRRYWVPGLSRDPDTRSVQIGLIWTLLVHLLLLLLAPQVFRSDFVPGRFVQPGSSARNFDIEITPESLGVRPVPTTPPPSRFVETNPDANNNIPDHSTNFGAQNQQAAQPVPDKGSTLHMPKTVGKKDFQNDSQVVTGQLQKPEQTRPAQPAQEQQAAEAKSKAPKKEEVPLQGFVRSSGDNPDAFGTDAVKLPEPSTGADKYVQGDKNTQNNTGSGAQATQAVRRQPLPRPHLAQVRPGILQDRPIGVSNVGQVAVDAHFSEFGDYLQELIDIVQIQWERILTSASVSPKSSTHVTITFRINSRGQIAEILKVDGDAGEYGTNAALSAIREPAPYRAWTREMVAVLGDDQVITFGFYYY